MARPQTKRLASSSLGGIMPAAKVACPHCKSLLKTAGPRRVFPAAQPERVSCPKCGGSFNLGPALPPIIQARPRRRSAWVGIVSILGVLLLIGGGAGTAYFL